MYLFRNRSKPGMMNMRDFLNLPIMKIQNLTKMFETSSLFSVRGKKICNCAHSVANIAYLGETH